MKRPFLAATLLAPLACPQMAAADGTAKDADKPNVIIILADDLGYGDLSCYGATRVKTPNADRLASAGVRMTDAHAVAATSTPSRYSLLTGEYSWRRTDTDVAAGNAGMIVRPYQYTLADMFKHQGYATCAIGKWHLGLGETTGEQDWNAPLSASPADLGFDYHYIMAATADRVPCVFIENGQVANYDPSAPIEVSYKQNFPGEPTGRDNPELLYNLKHSHGHDMSIVNGIGRIGYMKGGGKALWKDEDIADSITTHAVDFIRRHHDEPFFLYFCTNDVHVPRFPHERFRGKTEMGLRGDAIVEFDWSVGEILDALDELGIADNTLVILTSDNGPVIDDGYEDHAEELLGGHNPSGDLRGRKYSAFEAGTTVPMIVRWPAKVKGGVTSAALYSQIDLMASLGELWDARLPKGSARDSRKHLDALLGTDGEGCDFVVGQAQNRSLTVRTKEWKYIEPSDGPKMITWAPGIETGYLPLPQLFHLKKDRTEQHNVAGKYPEKVFELQHILRRLRK